MVVSIGVGDRSSYQEIQTCFVIRSQTFNVDPEKPARTEPTHLKIDLFSKDIFRLSNCVPQPIVSGAEKGMEYYRWTLEVTFKNGLDELYCVEPLTGDRKVVEGIQGSVFRNQEILFYDSIPSVCVFRGQVYCFLFRFLLRMGVNSAESQAFVTAWQDKLDKDADAQSYPYILIQTIDSEDLPQYFPEIKINDENTHRYVLRQYYFRLLSLETMSRYSWDETEYIEALHRDAPGENVVFNFSVEWIQSQHVSAGSGSELKHRCRILDSEEFSIQIPVFAPQKSEDGRSLALDRYSPLAQAVLRNQAQMVLREQAGFC